MAKETLHVYPQGLGFRFPNVVPEFKDFVVANRNDVEEVCALLIVGLGWVKRISVDD